MAVRMSSNRTRLPDIGTDGDRSGPAGHDLCDDDAAQMEDLAVQVDALQAVSPGVAVDAARGEAHELRVLAVRHGVRTASGTSRTGRWSPQPRKLSSRLDRACRGHGYTSPRSPPEATCKTPTGISPRQPGDLYRRGSLVSHACIDRSIHQRVTYQSHQARRESWRAQRVNTRFTLVLQ